MKTHWATVSYELVLLVRACDTNNIRGPWTAVFPDRVDCKRCLRTAEYRIARLKTEVS